MKKDYIVIGGAFLILLVVLFYFSPFSEVQSTVVCHNFEGVAHKPEQGDLIPLCGHLIGGKNAFYLPFRMKESEGTRFCLANIKKIEEACGITMDEVLLDDGGGLQLDDTLGFFRCSYLQLDNENWHVRRMIELIKTPKEYSETGSPKITASTWRSDNLTFTDTCSQFLAYLGKSGG
jgi:hypothetical protein